MGYLCAMKMICLSLAMLCLTCQLTAADMYHLNIEEGLPCSFVVDLCVDRQDQVWIATDNGLHMYDGTGITTINTHNSKLSGDMLNRLYYDTATDLLWIATKEKVSALRCATMQFVDLPDIDANVIQYVAPASDGGVWAGARGNGLIHYDAEGKKAETLKAEQLGVPESFISIYDDRGRLYIGTVFDGFSIVDRASGSVRRFEHDEQDASSLPGNQVYDFCRDHYGRLWIGTDHGLALMDEATGKFTNFKHDASRPNESLVGDHIYSLAELGNGELWICTDIGGISRLPLQNVNPNNPESTRFLNMQATYDTHGLSSANIRKACQDRFGNVWIANYGSGISCLLHQPNRFAQLNTNRADHSQVRRSVRGIYADTLANQVWASGENQVVVFDARHTIISRYDLTPHLLRPNGNVYCITRNGDSMYFGLRDNGLLRLDLHTSQISRVDIGSDCDVYALWNDSDGSLWIGTQTGAVCYSRGEMIDIPSVSSALQGYAVFGFCRDQNENLWINTFGLGIYIFDRNYRLLTRLDSANGSLSSSIVPFLLQDSNANIWAATLAGLVEFPKGDWAHPYTFGYSAGLTDVMIHAIAEDKEHNIWFSTDRGLSCLKTITHEIENYSYADGIPYSNFQHGSVACGRDGELYFGTHDGVCHFTPNDVLTPLQCSRIRLCSTHRATDKDNGGPVAFAFCISDQSQRPLAEYEYRIKGLSDDWTSLGPLTSIVFRDLPAGHYTFQARARLRNQEAPNADNVVSAKFRVLPPWWLSWWAILGYVALLVMAVLSIFKAYSHRLRLKSSLEIARRNGINERRLNHERMKFFTNITHELRTPLTLIIGPLDDISRDSQLPERLRKKVRVIRSNASQLLGLVNEILEFRKVETENRNLVVGNIDLATLVKEVGMHFKELNRNPNLQFLIETPPVEKSILADVGTLSTILNNLLSNAMKYTPQGEVRLRLRYEGDKAVIEVADTGYGISEKDIPYIFDRYYQPDNEHQQTGTGIGLAVVKSLATLHKAKIDVQSQEGQGTTFRLTLSTTETYPQALRHESNTTSSESSANTSPTFESNQLESNGTKPVILVVEDNADIRQYIVDSFADNYETLQATNGRQGYDAVVSHSPDLVISDIMMPEMDGIELCRRIKQDMRTCHIPVILLTAKDTIEDKTDGYESGADEYLTKPFSSRMLLACVANQFEQRRRLTKLLSEQSMSAVTSSSGGLAEEESRPASPIPALSRLDQEFLTQVNDFILKHIADNELVVADLCKSLAFSHSTLYRKIKSLTGISVNEYIRRERLRYAKERLQQDGLTVSEAAYSSGFSDLGYFIACFKKEFGATPSTFLSK